MGKIKPIKIVMSTLWIAAVGLITGCANQLPPSGGEIDKIPPEIINTYPLNGTINYSENYFELEFSEYVDKRSVQEAVFISPAIEGEIEYNWSGRSLEVSFTDTLLINTTYTITIGTDVIDINASNHMAEAFTFAFSTGDEIAHFEISGKVFDKTPSGVMIFAYINKGEEINPVNNKPNYISQVGSNGLFSLRGLSGGDYLVIAVRDSYKDLLYNAGEDQFGTPYKMVTLSKADSQFSGLNFFLAIEDTSKPHLANITMTDQYHITLEFSEAIDSSVVSSENFYFYDSTAKSRNNPLYFYRGKSKEYFLVTDGTLKETGENFLIAQNIPDKKGNVLKNESMSFVVTQKPDTIKPQIQFYKFFKGQNKIDYKNPLLHFKANDAILTDGAESKIELNTKSGKTVPFRFTKLDDATFRLTSTIDLKPKSDYTVTIDLKQFADAAGNMGDTLFTYDFTTINDLDFSGVSGILSMDSSYLKNAVVVLENSEIPSQIFYHFSSGNPEFNFNRVLSGNYRLWSFLDNDSSKVYTNGSILPFSFSEQFGYYADTLKLLDRWPVGDIELKME